MKHANQAIIESLGELLYSPACAHGTNPALYTIVPELQSLVKPVGRRPTLYIFRDSATKEALYVGKSVDGTGRIFVHLAAAFLGDNAPLYKDLLALFYRQQLAIEIQHPQNFIDKTLLMHEEELIRAEATPRMHNKMHNPFWVRPVRAYKPGPSSRRQKASQQINAYYEERRAIKRAAKLAKKAAV